MTLPATSKRQGMPSCREDAGEIQREIMALVPRYGFNEDQQFAIRLALEEALSNAIRHGNCNDPHKRLTVEYAVSEGQVEVTICDEGQGFSSTNVPDPTLEENLNRPCGRGVMLIRAYMTEVRYNEAGNCITMVKRREDRRCPATQADEPDDAGDSGSS